MSRKYGNKIMLREYKQDDLNNIMAWINDPETVKFLSDTFLYPQSKSQVQGFLDQAMSKDWKGFVISDRETGDYIGQIDYIKIDHKNRYGEIALVIGDPNNRSKGIGREAMELMINFGFEQLNLNRIELSCYDYNKRAIKLYKNLGFKEEGVRRKRRYYNNKYNDELKFSLLREEWKEINDDL
ncbi:MAG: GNAT family N-acetyltransferase [Halanaerobiales bacterium]|nr:GNAT family N-acetyltransferase [Halanaerobiales bacterium]